MLTKRCHSVVLFLLLAAPLRAGIITLDPADGNIAGSPGDTIGWGFNIDNSSVNWISFSQAVLISETNPSIGVYIDLIGPQGGPDNFVLAPNIVWTESFSALLQTGIGSFVIDPGAPGGGVDSGFIRVLYDSYTGDPNTCDSCTPTPFSEDLPFSVTVQAAAAPEPGTVSFVIGGLLVAAGLRRRKHLKWLRN